MASMWEYDKAMTGWRFFGVTYFDPEKNYRTTIITARNADDALVEFTNRYPRYEILSVRNTD